MLPFPVMPCTHVPAHPVQNLVMTAIYHIRKFCFACSHIRMLKTYTALILKNCHCDPTCYFINNTSI